MCALEAQSLGVPVVATPTDGLCDIIIDGVNGFLSENDDVLVDKLIDVITDQMLHQRMGEAAKVRMKKLMDQKNYRDTVKQMYEL